MKQPQAYSVMSKHLVTVGYEDNLESAYEKMQKRKIRHLAVVDDLGAVIGVISDRDIQRAMKPRKNKLEIEYTFSPKHRVKDYMSFPALHVPFDMDVEEIVTKMLKDKVSAFLVVDRNAPVGIVTTDDLLRLLASYLRKDESENAKFSVGEMIFGPRA